jgi:glycine betaine/proline transport system ATP-binding protein
MTVPAVQFEHVDVLFGERTDAALGLLDQGRGRDEILEQTGAVLGVHDASLSIGTGEICVLMGLSGSGKSSLLRCVNGLNAVARGRVLISDNGDLIDVANCEPATLRRLRMNRISMVFQQFALMPWRTIRDNVGLGLELRGLPKAERQRLVDEKLSLVRLEQWADKLPHELSGGMQQRVGLARALATDADILLMDEPFSALDPLIREHLQDELLTLQARLGKTIIFVSHDLDEALKIGRHIAIMEGGRIVQAGRPADIISHPENDYVRAFVANVNPLNVMTAGTLMRPLAELAREDDGKVLLDDHGDVGVLIDTENRPRSFTPADAQTAPLGSGMRELARLALQGPVAVIDDEGRLAGAVRQGDLISALTQRPTGRS